MPVPDWMIRPVAEAFAQYDAPDEPDEARLYADEYASRRGVRGERPSPAEAAITALFAALRSDAPEAVALRERMARVLAQLYGGLVYDPDASWAGEALDAALGALVGEDA